MSKDETNEVEAAFVWIPGQGIDEAASLRLRHRYPRPSQPMGEAWFMGKERGTFGELPKREAVDLSWSELSFPLFEAMTGAQNFGDLKQERNEWESWFFYYLAHYTSPQHFDANPMWVTGFVLFFPDSRHVREHDSQFLPDVLATLGRVILEPRFWTKGEINITREVDDTSSTRYLFCDYQTTNDLFSASMFMCWKYLHPEQIETWFGSVLEVQSAHWRAQLLLWLLGVWPLLNREATLITQLKGRKPNVQWEDSWLLDGFYNGYPHNPEPEAFLHEENIEALRNAIQKHITLELFFTWLDSFEQNEHLHYQVLGLSELFFEKFIA